MIGLPISVTFVSVCFVAVFIQCKKEDPSSLVKRHQMECIETTRVDPDLITKIKHGDWRLPQEKVQLVKEWSLCVLMKSGLMTNEGVYKMDVALSKVPETDRDNVEKLIDSCLSKKAIPAPDIAFEFVRCYQKAKGNYTRKKKEELKRKSRSTTRKPPRRNSKKPRSLNNLYYAKF